MKTPLGIAVAEDARKLGGRLAEALLKTLCEHTYRHCIGGRCAEARRKIGGSNELLRFDAVSDVLCVIHASLQLCMLARILITHRPECTHTHIYI